MLSFGGAVEEDLMNVNWNIMLIGLGRLSNRDQGGQD